MDTIFTQTMEADTTSVQLTTVTVTIIVRIKKTNINSINILCQSQNFYKLNNQSPNPKPKAKNYTSLKNKNFLSYFTELSTDILTRQITPDTWYADMVGLLQQEWDKYDMQQIIKEGWHLGEIFIFTPMQLVLQTKDKNRNCTLMQKN